MPPICSLDQISMVGTEESQRAAWGALVGNDELGNAETPMVMPAGLASKKPKMIPKRGKQ